MFACDAAIGFLAKVQAELSIDLWTKLWQDQRFPALIQIFRVELEESQVTLQLRPRSPCNMPVLVGFSPCSTLKHQAGGPDSATSATLYAMDVHACLLSFSCKHTC